MTERSLFDVVRPDLLESSLGLSSTISPKIGAIITFAANTEFRLERAIWRLQSHKPRGVKHATDAKPIGDLINMFRVEGAKLPTGPQRELIELWCDAAKVAFEFRHSIAHGAAFRLENTMSIHRNRAWEGEIRRRDESSLWGDEHTFEKIRMTFAILLRVINSFSNARRPIDTIGTPEHLRAAIWAKSVMGEIASDPGPWFEKY
jgi:hypothetical protein